MSEVLPVNRITPQKTQAVKVALGPNGHTAGVIAQLLAELGMYAGYKTQSQTGPEFFGGWRITLQRANDADQQAFPNDYIVVTDADYSDANGWQLQTTSRAFVYGQSAGLPGSVAEFIGLFQADTSLDWVTAPVFTPLNNLAAQLVFDQPTSPNGPFAYVVHVDDLTTGNVTDVTPTGLSLNVTTGKITATIPGLTDQNEYSATVSVTSHYGETATSPVSNTITATQALTVEAPPPPFDIPMAEGQPIYAAPIVDVPLDANAVAPPPITTVPADGGN